GPQITASRRNLPPQLSQLAGHGRAARTRPESAGRPSPPAGRQYGGLRLMWRLVAVACPDRRYGGRAAGKESGPMRALSSARHGPLARRRWLRAAPLAALAGNPAEELAKLEAQAAKLSRLYRGDLVLLTDAENAAKVTLGQVTRLQGRLAQARQEVARLAAASYMDGVQDPTVMILGGGDAQRMVDQAGTLQYLAGQRTAQEDSLAKLI